MADPDSPREEYPWQTFGIADCRLPLPNEAQADLIGQLAIAQRWHIVANLPVQIDPH
jgi:hypothetical protein